MTAVGSPSTGVDHLLFVSAYDEGYSDRVQTGNSSVKDSVFFSGQRLTIRSGSRVQHLAVPAAENRTMDGKLTRKIMKYCVSGTPVRDGDVNMNLCWVDFVHYYG